MSVPSVSNPTEVRSRPEGGGGFAPALGGGAGANRAAGGPGKGGFDG
jgi:hypothetical protein